jgi:hypothetical protein
MPTISRFPVAATSVLLTTATTLLIAWFVGLLDEDFRFAQGLIIGWLFSLFLTPPCEELATLLHKWVHRIRSRKPRRKDPFRGTYYGRYPTRLP